MRRRPIPHHIKVKTIVTAGVSLVTLVSVGCGMGWLDASLSNHAQLAALIVNLIWIWE